MSAFLLSKAATTPTQRIQGLDELRGIAILSVMWSHGTTLWTWMPEEFAGYGFHGVVLFFLISGLLITSILIGQKGTPGYFRKFYINRIFRIWPLMLLALGVSALCWPQQAWMVVFNLLMINNYTYAYGIEPMFRTDVMWSLAVEEQFYLLWPVITYFLSNRNIALTAATVVFFGLSFDATLLPGGDGIISKKTHGCMQYIAMGALIAFGQRGLRYLLAAWGAFFAFYLFRQGLGDGLVQFRWVWYGVTFLLALLVYFTVIYRPLVRWSPLAMAGRVCYGLYLIHFFISWAVLEYFGRGVFWQGTAYLVVSFLLAVISFRYFEAPLLAMRAKAIGSDKISTAVFGGMGIIVVVCVIALVPTLRSLYLY